jgi:hypothetical protein
MNPGNVYETVVGAAAVVCGACMLWVLCDLKPRKLNDQQTKKLSDLKKRYGWLYAIIGPVGLIWGIVHIVDQF